MIRLTFIDPTGAEHRVEAEEGQSVMQAAVGALVPGIEASCGGACVCATCHCYVDAGVLSKLAAPDATESSMLECVSAPRANSRLTCQIAVSSALDGARFEVAASQH